MEEIKNIEYFHREKLKQLSYKDEAIEKIVHKYIVDCTYEFANEYYKEKIKQLEKKDNWISVEDRLPDNHTECLIHGYNFGIKISIFSDYNTSYGSKLNKKWFRKNGSSHYSTKNITHWQPLPQPPKSK